MIDAGSGASRQWFVPPSEDPGTKGQPCETKVAAPAAPAVPRFVFFSHFPAGDLAGCRSPSRRLMRLKETPGLGRVSSCSALQSNRRRNKRQLYYLLTGRTADSPRQRCVRPCGLDARGREPCWDRGVSCLCVAASLLTDTASGCNPTAEGTGGRRLSSGHDRAFDAIQRLQPTCQSAVQGQPMGGCWCQDGSRDALSRGDVLCDGVTGWTGGQTKTQTSNDLRTNASMRALVRLWPSPLFFFGPSQPIPQRQELPSQSSDVPGQVRRIAACHLPRIDRCS